MSRRNQDLVSRVKFEVDSRMANASMQALQAHAEKLNQQVAEVNASIKALGDVPDDNPALLEYRKQLRRLNSDLKDVNTTMKDYTRGVKAAGELYRHYAMGNIEDMSIKAIRAGVNGMKKRLDNLKAGGDPGDAEEMRLIEAITTEADVVVKRFKTDYQHVVEEITRGGTVTEQTLKRTRDGLADLMQTAETEAEKNELTNYWQKVGAAIEAVAVENRRLRGEVADREEAMRIAYATDHEGSQQAIHDAETRADAARRENDELRQRLDLKQQQRRELEQEMDINSMQVRALMDRRDELKAQEKEDRAIRNQRVDDANKELNAARRAAKTQQQAYDEQKQTVEKLRTEVQGLTDDIRKMGEVKAEPKIDTSDIEGLKKKIESTIDELGTLEQQWDDKIADYIFEKYPTQATVSAKTKSPEGLKEREAMKKDTVLAQMQKQREQELNAVDERLTSLIRKEREWTEAQQQSTTATAAQGDALKDLDKLQDEYNQKVERRKQLEQELQAIQTASYNDDPKVKQLKAEIEKIEELIAVSDKYRKQFTKMSDEKFDEGFKGKDESRRSIWDAQKYLDDAYNDKLLKAPLANMDLPDADKYKDAAKRVAEGIVQNAQENVRRVIFEQIKDGRWTPEVMEENLQSMRNMMNNAGNSELGLKDNPEYQAYKYIVAQMERYLEVAKQVQAEREKIAGSEPFLKATQQDDYEHGIYPEGLSRQVEKREFQDLTGWRSWKAENDDREGRKSVELKKAQDEESESLGRLNKAKKESAEQTDAQAQSSEQLAQKQEQLSQKTAELNQQQDKLNGMVDETVTANQRLAKAEQEQTDARNAQAEAKKHEGEAVKKVEDELRGLTDEQLKNAQAYSHLTEEINADTAAMQRNITTEQEATREADRLRSGSIDKMEQALARLRESNRKLDPTIDKEEWERGERAIGQLTLRLEELKKQSAELRREPVLDMMTQRMQSLSTLSRDALTETKKFWETMAAGAEKGSGELAEYEQHLKSIALEEQARVREQGREAFAFFQREDYRRTNAADTEEQRKALVAYREALPADATDHIEAINALLEKHAQFVKEAAGEWMSLEKAMELASKAGTDQFAGSAKDIQLATQSLERQRDTIIATIREKRNLGQATKAEEDQLADLTKKLRSLKFEQDNVNMSQEKMRTLIETPANAVNLDELRAAIKRADGQLRQMEQSLGKNSDEYKRFAEQVRNAKNVMKEMEGQAKASATAWEKAFSRLKTYVVMYMGFNEVWQKVTGTARDLMDLSDRMGEVRKTTGFTADEVGRLSENLKKMDVRTSLTSLMEISASAGQLGLKTLEDVQGFTEAANKLMIALPEMGREATTEMMRVAIATGEVDKIRKQLQEGTVEGSSATAVAMEKIASTIDRLRASSASTAPEITDFVKRVGAVGAQSGITIDQVAALGSTVSSLGMRIEMSATALSRMIPAIRNNAFELAKAIGVTPDTIRNLFDTGRGMEVILMILQRIKDTGMDADSIEQMLGMAGMRDIMKDLNQQGARAGIVFSGLSQNVDELRRQLGVASEAYEENIAIQQEFDKMNETTAAKWERLKNAFEEMWVGDSAQRGLGVLIDMLRKVVDWIAEDGPIIKGLKVMMAYWAAMKMNIGATIASMGAGFKAMGTAIGAGTNVLATAAGAAINNLTGMTASMRGLRAATINARREWIKMDAAMRANIIGALVTALGFLIYKIWDMHRAAKEAAAEVGRFNQKIADERKALNDLFEPLNKSNLAQEERLKLINSINSQYGKYLGYMLSETASAQQLAEAHALIAKRIREETYERRIAEKEQQVMESHSKDVNAAYAGIESAVRGGILGDANVQDVTDILKGVIDNRIDKIAYAMWMEYNGKDAITRTAEKIEEKLGLIEKAGRDFIAIDERTEKLIDDAIERLVVDGKLSRDNVSNVREALRLYTVEAKAQHNDIMSQTSNMRSDLRGIQGAIQTDLTNNLRGLIGNIANIAKQPQTPAPVPGWQGLLKPDAPSFRFPWQNGWQGGTGFGIFNSGSQQPIQMPLPGQRPKINEKNAAEVRQYVEAQDQLRGYLRQYAESISESDREAAEAWLESESEVNRLRKLLPSANGGGGGGGGGRSTVWGTSEPGESTNWKEMTAEQLVNRREQMNKFVNSLQTDTDVKAVLNEDKALKKAIEAGMSSDMRTVIEWYNTERLKIQDELHSRHLTNTGDWLDPKKERGAKKQFRDEMDAYLHELDAYYTERKTRIEEAGNDEGLTEAEIRNRTLANEMEWQQRRAELQKLYSRKQQEVTQEELDAIYHIISERTGDTESFVKAQIAKTNQFVDAIEKSGDKGAAIVHRWMSQVELDTERSYLKGQQALTKQMKAIEAIIDRERPFNGITKQLRESLSTMDILTGDMRKEYNELMKADKDMRDFNERQGRAELQRTIFLLGEADQAYSTTIDRVMQQMREKGMTAWADWLSVRPEQQEALMAQLRQTYDAIQDAIKKEASQLKKQAEIMWNNILMPGGDGKTTLKQMLDRTVAQLGIDEGRVSRANSLIGAGASSERVADKLAIQQMRLQLTMQEHYYNLMKKQGRAHVDMLNQQADAAERRGNAEEATRKRLDAQHAEMALNLATAKEETELAKQREEIIARTEESQNRLYTELRSWADLLTSSLQGVMEASHAGDAEYYNERAKLNLTGKGGPGAGTYVVIDDAGTSDAKAHYEYLDERQALERQHEIEIQNAQAEAWRKLMDDLNMKMSEQITDWMNAYLQNKATEDNTAELQRLQQKLEAEQKKMDASVTATDANTQAVQGLTQQLAEGITIRNNDGTDGNPALASDGNGQVINGGNMGVDENGVPNSLKVPEATADQSVYLPDWQKTNPEQPSQGEWISPMQPPAADVETYTAPWAAYADASNKATKTVIDNNKKATSSAQSSFAKMSAAANLYGIAYQAMANDNLSATQKFQAIALQTIGSMTMAGLDVLKSQMIADAAAQTPGVLGKLWNQLGYWAAPVFAVFTGLLGGLMGLATSKISSSKSQIASVTGASASAGRLATGMLTYAEGNVNELTDPASLTPGRQYNVDGADGKTYRARYMGKGAKTHITNGPEFHLVGEAGREAIIDAKTTRLLQMNETGIWRDIQTLYNGGTISGLSTRRRRGTGVRAFADGNVGEFEEMGGETIAANGTDLGFDPIALQSSLDANTAVQQALLERLNQPIVAVNKWTGSDGIPAMYNKMQKEAQRHGEKYL